ncbi:MAG: SDR family oxidoreductase [Pseudidiomarina maritima]|nr:SDR family oxidoreductase [Pseudidiomarina maritima]
MSKHVVITGANRGIGLALTAQYLAQGDTVTAVCRSSSEALEQLQPSRIITDIDVTDTNAVRELAQQLADQTIDILINNAGLLERDSLGAIHADSLLRQFQVNAMGPLLLTDALRSRLHNGSKVVLITSRMGSMTDNGSGGYYGYRMSKAALNAAGVSLARDLEAAGVAVALLHPGFVQTEMVNHAGDISADQAATQLIARINELTLSSSGQFIHSNGESLPW